MNAQANLDRYTYLGNKGWATPQLVETQKAQVAQLQNAIKADQALTDATKVQLSFTRLTSPIDGVTGIRHIDVGNIISPANTCDDSADTGQIDRHVVLGDRSSDDRHEAPAPTNVREPKPPFGRAGRYSDPPAAPL